MPETKAVHAIGKRLTDQLRAAIKKKFDDERERLLEPVQAQVPGTDSGSSAGGVGEPKKRGTQAGEIKQKVFAEMKEWNTVNGIVAATGLTHGQVRGVLSSRKNRTEFQVRMTDGNKRYRLKPKKTALGVTPKAATGGVNQPVSAPTPSAVPTATLLEKFVEGVFGAFRIAMIGETAGEVSDEPKFEFHFAQQQTTRIGSDLAAIKRCDKLAVAESLEIKKRCRTLCHNAMAPCICYKELVVQSLCQLKSHRATPPVRIAG